MLTAAVAVAAAGGGIALYRLAQSPAAEPLGGGKQLVVPRAPKPLPPLRFADAGGRALGNDDFRGKVVLLNIWATWCTPCREEMPALDRLQGLLGGEGFEVVALSIDAGDAGREAARRFYADIGIRHLRLYHDASANAGFELAAVGVPTTLMLDREGREIGRVAGAVPWDGAAAVAAIRRHLKPPGVAHAGVLLGNGN
jgi:thiol-disulfide isomerase/thioredoxin